METTVLVKVGQRVRDLRKRSGLSQEELGEKAGFHFSYIGGVERAEKNITLVNLQKIADALDVPIIELFAFTKHKKMTNNEKDMLLNLLIEKLTSMNKSDLKKLNVLLVEIFEK
ncbi:helix-turn-helix domain-containing protein [Paenibacillus pini]|uniref:Transcriptional regulator n=1 Tax=Paenibacillus pini JCM 16418 TaxID=1236976 RepID=W7Y8U8_9BACL|nr:helix-turn-helix transcriptional regulator [Paenibacillus pini]GAF07375.1 transcriptional regulator [Paenibacillus pini JCM 16418]